MKKGIIITTIVVALILCLFYCNGHIQKEEQGDASITTRGTDSVPMLIMQVQKCARLYTAEYKVHKIVTHDDVIKLKGTVFQQSFDITMPLGDRKIAIPMNATLKAYIDFRQFSEKNIERQGRHITILLPDPKVTMTSSMIDQKNIKQYVSLTRANFSDAEIANYQQQGRAAIIASIPELGILETAQANAAKVLVPMMTEMGYQEKDITITFRKEYGLKDIQRLLNIED